METVEFRAPYRADTNSNIFGDFTELVLTGTRGSYCDDTKKIWTLEGPKGKWYLAGSELQQALETFFLQNSVRKLS